MLKKTMYPRDVFTRRATTL